MASGIIRRSVATLAHRKQKDQSPAGHTILSSHSGRQASSRRPCYHKGSAAASPLRDLAGRASMQLSYYTGHETIIASGIRPGMARWREQLFAFMHHNAQRPGAYFKIPARK
jgi:hypothetical protein